MSDEEQKEAQEVETPKAPKEETPVSEPKTEEPQAEETPGPEAEPVAETQAAAEEEPPQGFAVKLVGTGDLKPGMTVRVHEKIKDVSPKGEERERVQVFEGIIMGLRGSGVSRTMTVRKVSKGFGVEKIYPLNSPVVDKIELVKTAKVRRAKLWYLDNMKRRFKRKLKETWVQK